MGRSQTLRNLLICSVVCLAAITWSTLFSAQVVIGGPTVVPVGNSFLPNSKVVPFYYTWGDSITFTGSGWSANDTLSVHIAGPLNQPNVGAQDIVIGSIHTDGSGNLVPGLSTLVTFPAVQRNGQQPSTP